MPPEFLAPPNDIELVIHQHQMVADPSSDMLHATHSFVPPVIVVPPASLIIQNTPLSTRTASVTTENLSASFQTTNRRAISFVTASPSSRFSNTSTYESPSLASHSRNHPVYSLHVILRQTTDNSSLLWLMQQCPYPSSDKLVHTGMSVELYDIRTRKVVEGTVRGIAWLEKEWIIYNVEGRKVEKSLFLAVPYAWGYMGVWRYLQYILTYPWLETVLPPSPTSQPPFAQQTRPTQVPSCGCVTRPSPSLKFHNNLSDLPIRVKQGGWTHGYTGI